jgi:hypothetical protein
MILSRDQIRNIASQRLDAGKYTHLDAKPAEIDADDLSVIVHQDTGDQPCCDIPSVTQTAFLDQETNHLYVHTDESGGLMGWHTYWLDLGRVEEK